MATANHKTNYWRGVTLGVIFNGADVLDGYVPIDNWMPAFEHASSSYDPTNASASLNIYVSLHVASPGEGGTQLTNEVAGAFYARQAAYRGSGSTGWRWDVSDTANPYVENRSGLTWAKNNTGAPIVVTHIGLGRDASGAGLLIASMPLDTPVSIPVGASFAIGAGGIRIYAL